MTTRLFTRSHSKQQLPENTRVRELGLKQLGPFEATLEQFDIYKL